MILTITDFDTNETYLIKRKIFEFFVLNFDCDVSRLISIVQRQKSNLQAFDETVRLN